MTNPTKMDNSPICNLETAFRIGDFSTAIRLARIVRRENSEHKRFATLAGFLSCIYRSGDAQPHEIGDALDLNERELRAIPAAFDRIGGGQGLFACVLLQLNGNPDKDHAVEHAANVVEGTLDDSPHGTVIFEHPSAAINLAEWFASIGKSFLARRLICVVLGHAFPRMIGDDLLRLAALMKFLDAPFELWSDWCDKFIWYQNHLRLFSESEGWIDPETLRWVKGQQGRQSEVFDKANKFSGNQLVALYPALLKFSNGKVSADLLKSIEKYEDQFVSDPHRHWHDAKQLAARYPWLGYFDDAPQSQFIENGDWALMSAPTSDYSMGLAQWWRFLEWYLKSNLTKHVGSMFDRHPEWRELDKENLSKAKQSDEAVFFKLADPARRENLTLSECMIAINKCIKSIDRQVKSNGAIGHNASRLRTEAARKLSKLESFCEYFDRRTDIDRFLKPDNFTEQEISFFRNRASHAEVVSRLDACIGRRIVIRVMNSFFIGKLAERSMRPLETVSTEADWPDAELEQYERT